MKIKIFIFCALALVLFGCRNAEKTVSYTVENTLDYARNELVSVCSSDMEELGLTDGRKFIIIDPAGKQVAYQILRTGEILINVEIGANEIKKYIFKAGEPENFTIRAFGKQAPERFNDFLWENDKVAFRIYEKSLMATDGPSNGIDYWAKHTSDMIIEKFLNGELNEGKSYHKDYGEGNDCYKVGRTLGCGAMAPYINDTLVLGIDYSTFELLENGPLRVVGKVTYDALDVAGNSVVETRIITLDAGSQLSRIDVTFAGAPTMEVAAGIALKTDKATICEVNDMNPDFKPLLQPEKGYVAYTEVADKLKDEEAGINGLIFTGTVFPQSLKKAEVKGKHVLAITDLQAGKTATYYTGAAISKAGFTQEKWINYLDKFAACIRNPLVVAKEDGNN